MMTTSTPGMNPGQREQCYREGRELFHAQRYFDCHEVWEDLWRQSRGAQKQLLQGLIQAAVGCHHWQHGNPVGARRVWTRSLLNLRAAAPILGLDAVLAGLQSCLERCLRLADTEDLYVPWLDLEALPPNRDCGTAED